MVFLICDDISQKHESAHEKYQECVKKSMVIAHKRKPVQGDSTLEPKIPKIIQSFAHVNRKNAKSIADDLVTDYIVFSGISFNTVNHPDFKNLVNGLSKLNTEVNCLTEKTLQQKIEDKYNTMVSNIIKEIKKAKYVSTTSDIWSSFRRSFMGVTSHWIDENTLERRSAALACKRFVGTHDYKTIAEILNEIHQFYEIDCRKIAYGITDNGKNFVKAFREYKLDPYFEDDNIEFLECDQTSFFDLDSILNSKTKDDHDDENEFLVLPPHHRCCSHTLSLCCTTDVSNAAKSIASFGRIFHKSMGKLAALWNLTNRSANKASETYYSIIGRAPITPVQTRWNSQYDAINEILKHVEKFPELFKALSLPLIQECEVEFLKEFQLSLSAFAICLDKLQGDKNIHIGDIIPSIFAIEYKLNELINKKTLKYCNELCIFLRDMSLKKRFNTVFELNEEASVYILATVSLPKWKLKWVPSAKLDYVKNVVFANEVKIFENITKNESINQSNNSMSTIISESDRDFYKFIDFEKGSEIQSNSNNCGELQALQYLSDSDADIQSLHKYSIIKQICLKYNSGVPSSAPVERLFSLSGLVLTPKRCNLSDKRFEQCTLIKANSKFIV